ncbi:MAG: heavy-metal-associated domain-containing protein [Sphingobacteriales bacterium]|nr:MAG: heavy-metal-associated domain-containing protein [Sphingobacteriales bacterium]
MKKSFLSIGLFLVLAISFATNTLNLNVKGMHCGGCEAKFKTKIQDVKGVTAVKEVSAANSVAVLEYNPAETSEEKIIKQLTESSGYTIAKVDSNEKSESTAPKSCCSKSGQSSCKKPSSSSCDKSKSKK